MVETVEISQAHKANQVAVSVVVLGKKNEVIVRLAAAGDGGSVAMIAWRDIDLTPYDRPNPRLQCGTVELEGTKNITVIGHRHRRHSHFGHLFGELRDSDGRVEQGVVRVQVEMDKGRRFGASAHGVIIPRRRHFRASADGRRPRLCNQGFLCDKSE